MLWLRRLMKRSGIRRRQSKSPSFSSSEDPPLKRRSYAKDASYTEGESLCSTEQQEEARTALWRVENVRKGQGPPTEDEWWRTVSSNAQGRGDNGGESVEAVASTDPALRRFHNCGLETWELTRLEWTKQTVKKRSPKIPLTGYTELVKGLSMNTGSRTYELPRKMALSDLVDVYQVVWNNVDA